MATALLWWRKRDGTAYAYLAEDGQWSITLNSGG
jgi:hypothetical protein